MAAIPRRAANVVLVARAGTQFERSTTKLRAGAPSTCGRAKGSIPIERNIARGDNIAQEASL